MEVVIFSGLQGAGKSSFYRARFAATHLHLSKDNWPNASRREARLQRELRAALLENRDVVLDNTLPSRIARAPHIQIAREFGARVHNYFFESDFAACAARNALREGRACVPLIALKITAAQLQKPSLDEGFDELYFVRLQGDGFEVTRLGILDETTAI